MHRCALLMPLLLLSGCFKIERQSSGTPVPVTARLMGEWLGNWGSDGGMDGATYGMLVLSVQTFQGRPVLRLESDNPCLLPQDYTLTMVDRHLELRGNGDAVFQADFAADLKSLTGSYSCGLDRGTWSASWVRELAPIGDVSGHWIGTFIATSPVQTTGVLQMDLLQQWVNGSLRVTGRLSSPSLPEELVVTNGDVVFDEGSFQLRLMTDTSAPFVMMGGSGDAGTLVIDEGEIVLGVPPGTLVGSGTWRAIWTGP